MAVDGVVELRLLGRFVVVRGGAEIPAAGFGGRKVRTLLRVLATRRGSFVTHDALTDMLWSDRPPADPAANLQVLVNRARHALAQPDLLLTGPGGYALAGGASCRVDAEEFLHAVDRCRGLSGEDALAGWREALGGWRGEPLAEDVYADWAAPYRQRLTAARQEAWERGAAAALTIGETAVAVELARAAAVTEPLREVANLTLVRALAAAGDPVAALEQFARYRRALAAELGLDPSERAEAVHRQLLRGELTAEFRREPTGEPSGELTGGRAPRARPGASARFDELAFVGRDAELAAALDAVRTPAGGGPRGAVTISGRSGSGKSRLLGELAARVPTLVTRAFLPERADPWSLARSILREVLAGDATAAEALPPTLRDALASVVPELGPVLVVAVHDPESTRALLLEAAVRLLGTARDEVLVVDDLQWADPSSLLMLAGVVERLPALAVVLAYRPEEIGAGTPVETFLEGLTPTTAVALGPLPPTAIGQLVAGQPLADALCRGTDGSPLAVSEVLRALAAEGAAARTGGRWRALTGEAPRRAAELAAAGQRRAIATRVERHAAGVREVLSLLAVLAGEAPAGILADALDQGQRTVLDALGELSRGDLVRLGEQGWATAHDMVGEVVVAGLGPTDRGRLHGLVARALAAADGDPAEVGRHWAGAGDGLRAAAAYAVAAEGALAVFADSEAAGLADAGLALAARAGAAHRARLYEARATARGRLGDLTGARDDLRAALRGQRHGPRRVPLLAAMASLASGSDDLVRAAELAELALVEAGAEAASRARALEVAAILDMNLDRPERAASRAAEALAIYREEGDARGTARILDGRAMAAFLDGDIRGGTELLHRVAHLFEDSGDLMRVVTPRSTRGHGLVFLGRPGEGLVDTSKALELARSLGHPEGQAYALWHRTEALAALGDGDAAVADGREALAIAERLGHRGWTATAWRAIGIAEQCRGDLDAALQAFRRSLAASEHLDLFASWAAARCALVLVEIGCPDDAGPFVERALSQGPPLGHYEGRLARVALAAARNDPQLGALAAEALRLADAGGAVQGRRLLVELADRSAESG